MTHLRHSRTEIPQGSSLLQYRGVLFFRSEAWEHRSVKRREFITLISGATAAWPFTVRAQQPERMRRIGVLMSVAADDPEGQTRVAALVQLLQ
jgi:hypothetical protein